MTFDELLARWTTDAATYRRRWPADPIAATLELCAAEIREAMVGQSGQPLTAEEYARREQVSVQTVTSWCRRGELEAYKDMKGCWRIPAHARRAA